MFALGVVASRLKVATPRLVDSQTSCVFFVFTDACSHCETREGGIGGFLLGPDGCVVSWFGEKAPSKLYFMTENQEQASGELEAFAVLVALQALA